jgi:hypothetical protein
MNKDTALRMSLDALEWIYKYVEAAPSELTEAKKWASIIGPKIPRIKEALQSNEQVEPVAWMIPSWIDPDTRGWQSESFEATPVKGWIPLYTHPPVPTAQPEQEPDEVDIRSRLYQRIHELETQLTQIEQEPVAWISVKDALPKAVRGLSYKESITDTVLVRHSDRPDYPITAHAVLGEGLGAGISILTEGASEYPEIAWYSASSDLNNPFGLKNDDYERYLPRVFGSKITHWMPIPTPPQRKPLTD